jgi:hypothetical protein
MIGRYGRPPRLLQSAPALAGVGIHSGGGVTAFDTLMGGGIG